MDEYLDKGFLLARNFVPKNTIDEILNEAQQVYKIQLLKRGIINSMDIDDNTLEQGMKRLFREDNKTFINCGKQCQHLISLHRLSLDDKILSKLKELGLVHPVISTRPVLFSNCKDLSLSSINHTVPPHQDWASMQGSINSVIVWFPLVDIPIELGPVCVVPGSHTNGLISTEKKENFGLVETDMKYIQYKVNRGDALLFSSFLVHKSGDNITDNIRWSCHFRYNDLMDSSFIDRGFPHAYIYRPIEEYINPNLDTKKEVQKVFGNINDA